MTTKAVLITGATRGIGLKLTELYVKLGWKVIGTARKPVAANQLKAVAPYKILQLDSSDEMSIVNAARQLEGEPIDLVVNNAGIFSDHGLQTTTKSEMVKLFEVNSVGPFLVTRAFVPHLKAAVANNGEAYVAQISSIVGSIELSGHGYYAYRASKAALNMINASLALDLKHDKIGAFALHPGYVVTDMTDHKGKITTEASAQGLINVIDKLVLADTGKFYDYTGKNLPW